MKYISLFIQRFGGLGFLFKGSEVQEFKKIFLKCGFIYFQIGFCVKVFLSKIN